jgi:sirohydrochlorin cobaltochelatase
MRPTTLVRGIVLLAHGSKDPLWHQPIAAVAKHISATSPTTPVVCAYLELSQPDLLSSVMALITAKVNSIAVIPMFLGVGKHVRDDLPQLINGLRQRFPGLQFELRPPVGEDQRLIQLLAKIALDEHKQVHAA